MGEDTLDTIIGLTNWLLTIRREENGVSILRALTCDEKAILPDFLFGLPVTELQDHALAAGADPAEGEEVRILGGEESGEWDNRKITELTLPRYLQHIGAYAFMNLRAMVMLHLSDELHSVGSAIFMNCRLFSRLEIKRFRPLQGPALALFAKCLQQELDVTVSETDGTIIRLIFPEYLENYVENSAAHHFQLEINGGGYAYHGVFRGNKIFLTDYDALWPAYISQEHDEESALRLAFFRFRYPTGLSEQARIRYSVYLRENMGRALSLAMKENDASGLRMLLRMGGMKKKTLDTALKESRTLQMTEATALLLEESHRNAAGSGMRKYEL